MARELSIDRGVLEPLQTRSSVDGQVLELKRVLERHATLPVALAGASWGAWLSLILAARYPSLVEKLVLVGSAPFEESYASSILPTRLERLPEPERAELGDLLATLDDPAVAADRNVAFARTGVLLSKADAYDATVDEADPLPVDYEVYRSVWSEAAEMRRTGGLLALAGAVRCPVLAIHGDHDPHPADGVRVPLARSLPDFRFVLLDRCGHEPWNERHARERFYALLREALA